MDSRIREAQREIEFGIIVLDRDDISELRRTSGLDHLRNALTLLTADSEPCITVERESDKQIIVNGDPNHHIKKGIFSNKVVDVKSNLSPMNEIMDDFKHLDNLVENIIFSIFETLEPDYQGFEPNKILKRAMLSYASQVSDKRVEELREQVETLREALTEAKEAMNDRRGHCEAWEWKYKDTWNREDHLVNEALATTEPKPPKEFI